MEGAEGDGDDLSDRSFGLLIGTSVIISDTKCPGSSALVDSVS